MEAGIERDAGTLGDGLLITTGVVAAPIAPFRFQGQVIGHIHAVFARLTDRHGRTGFGHSLFLTEAHAADAAALAAGLAARCGPSLGALLEVEATEQECGDGSVFSHSAANAISLAAWDLRGRQTGVSCAVLWGGAERPLAAYDSCHLPFAALDDIPAAIDRCRAEHFTAAKIAVGSLPLDEDIARIGKAFELLGPGNLAVDAVRRWTAEQTRYVLDRIPAPLMWLEDPVPYQDLSQLVGAERLAVGETCCTRQELDQLVSGGARMLLPDLGCIGGPLRFLAAARELAAQGIGIGSHGYPYYSLHLLGCIDNTLPLEFQDWGSALFVAPPRPDGSGRVTAAGPGLGLTVNEALLAQAGNRRVDLAR